MMKVNHTKAYQNMLLALGLVLCSFSGSGEVTLSTENKLKAAYLFNFTKFIEWPAASFKHSQGKLNLCIDTSEVFTQFLTAMVTNRQVGKEKREINVVPPSSTQHCHLRYHATLPFENADNAYTVTISDDAKRNALITFVTQNNKVRFQVSRNALDNTDAKFSSQLLKLAHIKD